VTISGYWRRIKMPGGKGSRRACGERRKTI